MVIESCGFIIKNNMPAFIFFKKMDHTRFLFIYFRLFKQTLQFLQKICEKMSIQYTVLVIEPKTFRT